MADFEFHTSLRSTKRVASRHMPKILRPAMTPLGWLVVSCSGAGAAYIAATRPPVFLAFVTGVAALWWLARAQCRSEERELLLLATQRDGQSICEFARDFDARAIDTWIIRAVYEQVQTQLSHVHPSFPVRANDRLKQDLRLDGDDLDLDLAPAIEARTGRSLGDTRSNPYFGKVRTVRDLVHFFQHQPKVLTKARAS